VMFVTLIAYTVMMWVFGVDPGVAPK